MKIKYLAAIVMLLVVPMTHASVIAYGDSGEFSISESPFIQIIKPNDNELLTPNTQYTIEWTSQNLNTGKIRILFSSDGGNHWSFETWDLPLDTTSYDWNVPDTTCSNCVLRVGNYNPSPQDPKKGDWIVYDDVTFSIGTSCGNGNVEQGEVCDPPGSACGHYIQEDYCYYGGTCSNDCGSCSGAQSDYCPTAGTIKGNTCYYGISDEARCTDGGCLLFTCELGEGQYCDAIEGCEDSNPPGPKYLDVDILLTNQYPDMGETIYAIIFVREVNNGITIKHGDSDTTINKIEIDGENYILKEKWNQHEEWEDDMTFSWMQGHCNPMKFMEKVKGKCGSNWNNDYNGYWVVPIDTGKYHSLITVTASSGDLTGSATASYQIVNGVETNVVIPAPTRYEVPIVELDGIYYGNFSRGQNVYVVSYGKIYRNGIEYKCTSDNCHAEYKVVKGEDATGTTVVDWTPMPYNPFVLGFDKNVTTSNLECGWYTILVNITDSEDGWWDQGANKFFVDCSPRVLVKRDGKIIDYVASALGENDTNIFDVEVYNPSSSQKTFTLKMESNDTPNPINILGLTFLNDGTEETFTMNSFDSTARTVHMDSASRAGAYNVNFNLYDGADVVAHKNVRISVFAESLTEFVTRSLIVLIVGAGILFAVAR